MFKESYLQHYQGQFRFVEEDHCLEFESGKIIPVNIFMGIDPASSVKNMLTTPQ